MVVVVAVDSGSGIASVEGPAAAAAVARLGSMDQEHHVLDQVYVVAQSLEQIGSDRLEWGVNDPSIYLLLPRPDHQLGRRVYIGTHLFSALNSSLLFRFTYFQCRVVLVQPLRQLSRQKLDSRMLGFFECSHESSFLLFILLSFIPSSSESSNRT